MVGILAAGFFSGMETGAYCLNRLRLRYRQEKGWRSARLVNGLLRDPQTLIATTLVGHNLAIYVVTSMVSIEIAHWGAGRAELWSTLILTPLIFAFAEVAPKDLFRNHADTLFYALSSLIRVFKYAFYPVTFLLKALSHGLALLLGIREAEMSSLFSRSRLRHTFFEGAREKVLTDYQDQLARNIMELKETTLKEVMVPRKKAVMLSNDLSPEDVLDVARKNRFSRYPVYQGRPSNLIGIVNVFELFFEERPGLTIRNYIREVPFLHQESKVDSALLKIQKSGQPMGIVTDGRKAVGIVTIKDLVEEIVGELKAW
jgi:CBS domain containing-hemolysin-like protein